MENQPKKKSPVGIILLIILLLLAGAVGYLYYSVVKAPLELEDPQKIADSAPMSPGDRFRVSAADGTVRVKLDAGDLWSVILRYTGKDVLELINQEVSPYGLTVSGCGIYIDEEGLGMDLELYYKETRLVAKVPCALEVSGQHLSLSPTDVKLGVIPLPVGGLLSGLKLEYDVALPVISDVTQVAFEEGAVVLTGPLEPDIRALVPQDDTLYRAAVFCESMQSLVDYLGEDFDALLADLEQNPGNLENVYRQLFILGGEEITEGYLESRHGLTQRFFPGIDFTAVIREQLALSGELTDRTNLLELLFTCLVNDYSEKHFRLSDGVFLLNYQPLNFAQYQEGYFQGLYELLNPEDFFLVLVNVEDGFIRKTSSFYRMADENQQFTQEVDFNKTYILGCVFRGVDGDPFLLYESEIDQGNTYVRDIKIQPMTEADVAALQVEGKFGVWTGQS